jgi:predicted nucleic acid-binding protein
MRECMKALLDVNIFVDVFERRNGWTRSMKILSTVKSGDIEGFISILTIPILYFLRSRYIQEFQAREDIKWTTSCLSVSLSL